MLTSDHAILEFDDASGLVRPDQLSRKQHGHYLKFAQRMLQVYQRGSGRTRRELHGEVENVCAALEDCPSRRIAAFCKLLDEVSVFDTDRRGAAAKLRQQVFSLAAPLHPLVSSPEGIFLRSEAAVKRSIAEQLGMTWEEIDNRLFADVIEFQRLRESFPAIPTRLRCWPVTTSRKRKLRYTALNRCTSGYRPIIK
jgi:predicted nuclease of restriction endonuclease-like RecB superfamily